MQIIALDVGTKRIGVAKADTKVRIAVPDGTINVTGAEFTEIGQLLKRYQTDWVILGLPRNSKGEETAQSAYVRDFAKKLKHTIPTVKIRFQDESLTSVEAEKRLRARKGYFYAKGEVDSEAASIILQDFIENFSTTAQIEANPSDEPNIDLEDKNDHSDRRDQNPYATRGEEVRRITVEAPESLSQASENLDRPTSQKAPKTASAASETAKNGKSLPKKLMITLAVILTLGVAVGICTFAWYRANLLAIYPDVTCTDETEHEACKKITFSVKSGETTTQIIDNLAAAGLIRNSVAGKAYYRLHYNSADSPLRVGEYKLDYTLSTPDVLAQLVKGENRSNVFSFTILPGETVSEVKKRLVSEQGYAQSAVDAAFAKTYDFPMLTSRSDTSAYKAEPLEGFLFGDTYEFYKGDAVDKIVSTALAAMQAVIDDNHLEEKFAAQDLSLYEGITLASIVQRESVASEQPKVAQVFLNRLKRGISLGSDVTTQYALDLVDPDRTTYTNNATALAVDSLYNTRIYSGLTPGPICNPGRSALLAVAEPEATDAIFFLTGDDGVMYYSSTEEGHNQNIRDHCADLCNVSL